MTTPSPLLACSRMMTWPLFSPPSPAPLTSMPSKMYLSPTGVRMTWPPASSTVFWRPPFDRIETTRAPLGSRLVARRSRARTPSTASPSTTQPAASTAIRRSASPSSANPTSAPRATTSRWSAPGAVAPQPSLMLVPSGSLKSTCTSAPVASRIRAAAMPPEPLAQSTTIRSRVEIDRASSRRRSTYRSKSSRSWIASPSLSAGAPGSSSAVQMSCSSSSSTASSSFRPCSSRTLRPLSSAGLCEAETMIPAANLPAPVM